MITDDKKANFVEEMGLCFDTLGGTRMAGRIFGCLLVANPPHKSTAELVESLEASHASISTMTRQLVQIGFIEKVAIPGKRSHYFRIRPDAVTRVLQAKMISMPQFRQVLERGLELIDTEDQMYSIVNDMVSFYAWMEEKIPALIEEWEETRKNLTFNATAQKKKAKPGNK